MNKKNFLPFLFMLLCVATTMTACGKEDQPSETNPEETITENAGRTLIVYFLWGGHLAPPVKSFLAGYNLAGKSIAPFCTHGGSGTAQSVSDIRFVCTDVTILKSLAVYGNRTGNARGEIAQWLKQIGIIR